MIVQIPNGLDEIMALYGSLDDPEFERVNIVLFRLPYPLLYAGLPMRLSRCHRLAEEHFRGAFQAILDAGLDGQVQQYGGIYNRRQIRGAASHPSTHSWGIAVDLEPERYPLGSVERFADEIVQIFHTYGFMYGGDFRSRKDPMHFQLCRGY